MAVQANHSSPLAPFLSLTQTPISPQPKPQLLPNPSTVLPALDRPTTLPAFADEKPPAGVILPLVPDADIPGEREPTILPAPSAVSPQCPAPTKEEQDGDFMKILFAEDPLFKAAA